MKKILFACRGWLLLTGIILFIVSIGIGHSIYLDILERVPPNVFVNNIDVGGIELVALDDVLEKIEKEMLEKDAIIQYTSAEGAYLFHYPLSTFGLTTNKLAVKKEVEGLLDFSYSMYDNLSNYRSIKEEGKFISMDYENFPHYHKFANTLQDFHDIPLKAPVDAFFYYDHGEIKIQPDVVGEKFDYEGLLQLFNELEVNPKEEIKLEMPIAIKEAAVSEEDLIEKNINNNIASFSTSFSTSDVPRTTNIKIATSAINGLLLAPNQEFSFNEIVGRRTTERGYQVAGVFMNGRVASGIGGGVCQVSSTLYNTALQMELEILERHPHSLPVAYLPRGRDAAISWDLLDLRFRNNLGHYIYIHGRVEGNRVFFEFFGP